MNDEPCVDCYITGSLSAFRDEHRALEAEVAQLRQDRDKSLTEVERLTVIIGDQAERLLEAGKHAGKLEAARDHLRASLREAIALLQAIVDDAAGGQLEGDYAGCVALNDERISQAADLLAILTEPEEKK